MLRRVEASLPSLTHVRLGLLTGDLRTGLAADHDQLSMFLRGLASLGAIPKQARTDRAVDLTPVDQAARMLAALIRQARTNQTFHIANARHATLGDIIETMKLKGVRLRRRLIRSSGKRSCRLTPSSAHQRP
ncbi:MAG: hypothetical protein U0165_10450 [Polyangiaceae bacterium]